MIKYILPFIVVFFVGCGSSSKMLPENTKPVADIQVNKTTLFSGEELVLDASGSNDSDGTIARYEWLDNDSARLGTESIVRWTAPDEIGNYFFTLRVTDNDDAVGTAPIMIVVIERDNNPPTASIVAPLSLTRGETITLDGSDSNDSDGEIVSYNWSDTTGSSLGTGVNTEWTPTTTGEHNITLLVRDDSGATGNATATILVNEPANQAPVANISPSTFFPSINKQVTLDGSGSSDDDGVVTYQWSGQNVVPNGSSATFISTNAGTYTVTLRVLDEEGLDHATSITLQVIDAGASFSQIQGLIEDSNNSVVSDVTYICVGDSTRANSALNRSHLLFERVQDSLDEYNVTSHLMAQGSQELNHFNTPSLGRFPTYLDVIGQIPGTGSSTIVDISLGINDLYSLGVSSPQEALEATALIKERLREAVSHIKDAKPDTIMLFTSPNADYVWASGTEVYMQAYRDLSEELGVPFVNFHDNVYIHYTSAEQEDMYRFPNATPADNIHYSDHGLATMADYILSQILPSGG